MEPTRVEIDFPQMIITNYAHLQLTDNTTLEDVVAPLFTTGAIVAVHIIVESTGGMRAQCQFIDPESTYKTPCGMVLSEAGKCRLDEAHNQKIQKQLELAEAEMDSD
jgi:hypothetical protein